MLDRFSDRIDELEAVVRKIAVDITTGTFVERLPPGEVWEKTGYSLRVSPDKWCDSHLFGAWGESRLV